MTSERHLSASEAEPEARSAEADPETVVDRTRGGAPRPESARPESARHESARHESARPESAPSAPARPEPRVGRENGRPAPSAPSANGAGPHAEVQLRPDPIAFARTIREETDWDAFLPERASSFSWRAQQAVKRALDVMVSLTALVLLSPVLLVLALVVKLTSPGPAFYRWKVLGRRARPFVGFKFRSMVENADQLKATMEHLNHMEGPAFKIRNDPRTTPVGRWLRKLSLDELPQLWSVLKGDMSLVGPRPPFPEEFVDFKPWHRAKLAVKPGITCYWQVQGRSDIHDFDEWARLDLDYIRDWNLWVDLKILVRTIPVVIRGHGAY